MVVQKPGRVTRCHQDEKWEAATPALAPQPFRLACDFSMDVIKVQPIRQSTGAFIRIKRYSLRSHTMRSLLPPKSVFTWRRMWTSTSTIFTPVVYGALTVALRPRAQDASLVRRFRRFCRLASSSSAAITGEIGQTCPCISSSLRRWQKCGALPRSCRNALESGGDVMVIRWFQAARDLSSSSGGSLSVGMCSGHRLAPVLTGWIPELLE